MATTPVQVWYPTSANVGALYNSTNPPTGIASGTTVTAMNWASAASGGQLRTVYRGLQGGSDFGASCLIDSTNAYSWSAAASNTATFALDLTPSLTYAIAQQPGGTVASNGSLAFYVDVAFFTAQFGVSVGGAYNLLRSYNAGKDMFLQLTSANDGTLGYQFYSSANQTLQGSCAAKMPLGLVFLRMGCAQWSAGYYGFDWSFYMSTNGAAGSWTTLVNSAVVVPTHSGTQCYGPGSTNPSIVIGSYQGSGNAGTIGRYLGHCFTLCSSGTNDFSSATQLPVAFTPPPWGVYVNAASNAPSGGLGTSNSYMSALDFNAAIQRGAFLSPSDKIFTYGGTPVSVADVPPNADILRASWSGGTIKNFVGTVSGGSFVTSTYAAGTLAVSPTNVETVYISANGGVPQYPPSGTNALGYGGLGNVYNVNYTSDTPGVTAWVKQCYPYPKSAWSAVTTVSGSGSTVTSVWPGSGGPITNVYSATCTFAYPAAWQNLDVTSAGVLPHVISGTYTYAGGIGTVTWAGSPFPSPGAYSTAYLVYPDVVPPSIAAIPARTSNAVAVRSSTPNSITFSGPLYRYDNVNLLPPGTGNIVSYPNRNLSSTLRFAPTIPSAKVAYTAATGAVALSGTNPYTGSNWMVNADPGAYPTSLALTHAYVQSTVSASYSGMYAVSNTGSGGFYLVNGPSVAIPDMSFSHAYACIAACAAFPGSAYLDPTNSNTYTVYPTGGATYATTGNLYVSPYGNANLTTAGNNAIERSHLYGSGPVGFSIVNSPGGVVQNIALTNTMMQSPYGSQQFGGYAFGYQIGSGIAIFSNCFGDMTDKHAFGNVCNLSGHARGAYANCFGGRGPNNANTGQQWPLVDYVGGIAGYPSTMQTAWWNTSIPYNAAAVDGVGDNVQDLSASTWGGHGGAGVGWLTLYPRSAAVAAAMGASRSSANLTIAAKTVNTNNFAGSYGCLQLYVVSGSNVAAGDSCVIYDGVSSNTFSFVSTTQSGTNVLVGGSNYASMENLYAAVLLTGLTNSFTPQAGDIPANHYFDNSNLLGGATATGLSWQAATSNQSVILRSVASAGCNGNMRAEECFFATIPYPNGTIAAGFGYVNTLFAPNFAYFSASTSPLNNTNSNFAGVLEMLKCGENYSTNLSYAGSGPYVQYFASGGYSGQSVMRKTDCWLALKSGWGLIGGLSGISNTGTNSFAIQSTNQRYITPDGSPQLYLSAYGGGASPVSFSGYAAIEPTALTYASYALAGISPSTNALLAASPLVGAGSVSIASGLDITAATFNARNSIGPYELPSLQVSSIAATAQNRLRVTLSPSSIVALPLSLASSGFTLTYAGVAYANFTVEYATTYNGFFDIVLPPGTAIFQTGTSTLSYVPGVPSISDAAGTPLLAFTGLSVTDTALPTVAQLVSGSPPQIPGTALTLDDVDQPTIASGVDNTLLLYVEPGTPQVVAFESSAYWPVFITAACPYGTGTLTFASSLDAGNVSAYASQAVRQESGTNTAAPTVTAGTTPRFALESLSLPYLRLTATSVPVRVIITTRSPMTRIVTALQI